jgi:hypothetical protein
MLELMSAMSLTKVVTSTELSLVREVLTQGQTFLPASMRSVKQGLYQLAFVN